MRIITVIVTLIIAAVLFTIASAHALELALKEEGPSFDETIKWVKSKIESLPRFNITEGTLSITNKIESTYFDVDRENMMTIVQSGTTEYFYISTGRTSESKYFYKCHCDLNELNNESSEGGYPPNLYISFNSAGSCKTYFSKNDDPSYSSACIIPVKNPDDIKKLVKAFNHLAELTEKIPKKRKKDLF